MSCVEEQVLNGTCNIHDFMMYSLTHNQGLQGALLALGIFILWLTVVIIFNRFGR